MISCPGGGADTFEPRLVIALSSDSWRHKCNPARQLNSFRISAREQTAAAIGRARRQRSENTETNPPEATYLAVASQSRIVARRVNLTRVSDDLYEDTTGRGFLKTQFCDVYTYGEDVLILRDRVIFISSRESCDLGSF